MDLKTNTKTTSKLEIITEDTINLLLLNDYERFIYNYYMSGGSEKLDKYEKSIINNNNCSLYFATYFLSTIKKYNIDKIYDYLSLSKYLYLIYKNLFLKSF